jgi:hypothetical protein
VRVPRLPKSIKLMPGMVVPVKAGTTPGWSGSYTPVKDGGPFIEIDPKEPLWEQWETYGHELIHAAIDAQLYIQRNIVAPLRLEAERTARELAGEE